MEKHDHIEGPNGWWDLGLIISERAIQQTPSKCSLELVYSEKSWERQSNVFQHFISPLFPSSATFQFLFFNLFFAHHLLAPLSSHSAPHKMALFKTPHKNELPWMFSCCLCSEMPRQRKHVWLILLLTPACGTLEVQRANCGGICVLLPFLFFYVLSKKKNTIIGRQKDKMGQFIQQHLKLVESTGKSCISRPDILFAIVIHYRYLLSAQPSLS